MFKRIFGTTKRTKKDARKGSPAVVKGPSSGAMAAADWPAPPRREPAAVAAAAADARTGPTSSQKSSPVSLPPGRSTSTATDGALTASNPRSAAPSLHSPVTPGLGAPVQNFSIAVHSDPVPAAFRTGDRGALSPQSSASHRPDPLSGSHSGRASRARRVAVGSLGGSFGSGVAANGSSLVVGSVSRSAGGGDGGVNYWRLPWTQQKVVMCQYCNRPQRPRQPAAMNSHERRPSSYDGVDSDGDEEGAGCMLLGAAAGRRGPRDVDEACSDNFSSSSDDDDDDAGLHGSFGAGATPAYCRCGQSAAAAAQNAPADGTAAAALAPETSASVAPPVFIVETERSANVLVPGTIADDASSSSDSDDGAAGSTRAVKLSLVSPLTSHMLLRRGNGTPPLAPLNASCRANGGSALRGPSSGSRRRGEDGSDSSVSSWLHEQQRRALGEAVLAE